MWELTFIFGLIGISFVLTYINFNLVEEHFSIKIFLFFINLFILIITSRVLVLILESNTASQGFINLAEITFWVLLVSTFLLFVYMFYYVIKNGWDSLGEAIYKISKFKK